MATSSPLVRRLQRQIVAADQRAKTREAALEKALEKARQRVKKLEADVAWHKAQVETAVAQRVEIQTQFNRVARILSSITEGRMERDEMSGEVTVAVVVSDREAVRYPQIWSMSFRQLWASVQQRHEELDLQAHDSLTQELRQRTLACRSLTLLQPSGAFLHWLMGYQLLPGMPNCPDEGTLKKVRGLVEEMTQLYYKDLSEKQKS